MELNNEKSDTCIYIKQEPSVDINNIKFETSDLTTENSSLDETVEHQKSDNFDAINFVSCELEQDVKVEVKEECDVSNIKCENNLTNSVENTACELKENGAIEDLESLPHADIIDSSNFINQNNQQLNIPGTSGINLLPDQQDTQPVMGYVVPKHQSVPMSTIPILIPSTPGFILIQDSASNNEEGSNASSNREDNSDEPNYADNNASKDKEFKCSQCDYKTTRKGNFKQHMHTHTGQPYKCPQCDYKVLWKKNLEQHMNIHTGEFPYKCTQCPFKTSRKHNFKEHMSSHTGEYQFNCTICDYKTPWKSCFKSHMNNHTGDHPYKCNFCDFKASKKYAFKIHMYSHTGDYPYKCTQCIFKTSYKHCFTAHMAMHTGTQLYKCDICSYKTAVKFDLGKHLKTHKTTSTTIPSTSNNL